MEKTWWERFSCPVELTARDRHNQRMLMVWSVAWASTWVEATFLIERVLETPGVVSIVTALAPNVLGIATLLAYMKFLRETEELQRKVQLDALALGFGIGIVAMVGLELLGRTGLLAGSPSDALIFMVAAYSLGVTLGWRRYR